MNIVEQLEQDRQALVSHLATVDFMIERFKRLSELGINTLANGRVNGHTNGHAKSATSRRTPAPKTKAKPKVRGETQAIILRAAKDWMPTASILKYTVPRGISQGTTYATISLMAQSGDLERRGEVGSYEYRRKGKRKAAAPASE